MSERGGVDGSGGGCRRRSARPRLPLAALLLMLASGAAGLRAQGPGVEPPDAWTRIESIRLTELPEGVELKIATGKAVKWSIRDPGGGEIVVRLRDCLPGPELRDLAPAAGLVAAVAVASAGTAESPETRIAIRTRRQAKYRVSAGEAGVAVVLLSRESLAEAEPAPAGPPALRPRFESEPPDRVDRYRIGPGDVLEVDVFGLDELDRKVRVRGDGRISLPLLGDFAVAGLDLEGAKRRIAGMLRDRRLVREPEVSIFVEQLVSRGVAVQGAVVSPGVYQLIGSRSLIELIGEAGGLRANNGGRVMVLREEAGVKRKLELDLEFLVSGAERPTRVALRPGDVVMVPFSRQHTVYVTGAVERPGPVTFASGEGLTVLQAITAAGGLTPRAKPGRIHILRQPPDGGRQKIDVNLKRIQRGKQDDVLLQRNDTVVVGEWFF